MKYVQHIASLVAILAFCGGCGLGGPDLTGEWKGGNTTIEISKEGETYKMVCHNPGGLLSGTYAGRYENGAIKVNVPFCGEITYSKDADKLYMCGTELSRAQK